MRKKFAGQFDALTKTGATFCNQQRFWGLHKEGKPLWEFKEHDHRLYCYRIVRNGSAVVVVLFNGWVKDKKGKTEKEKREIGRALELLAEFLQEFPGGRI
jgi:hypothetical protein